MLTEKASCKRGFSPMFKENYGRKADGERGRMRAEGVHIRGPGSLANQLKRKIGIREMDLQRNNEVRP